MPIAKLRLVKIINLPTIAYSKIVNTTCMMSVQSSNDQKVAIYGV